MCQTFAKDDAAYETWVQAHPDGWVFNHFGGSNPTYNVLHRAGCSSLARNSDAGHRTDPYPKVCCDNQSHIEAEADRLRSGRTNWNRCKMDSCR